MYLVVQARSHGTVGGALDQSVSQMEGVEDTGIVERDGRIKTVGLDQVLCVLGKRFHCSLPFVELRLQREHIIQEGAALFADVAKWQIAPVQAYGDKRTKYTENG